MDKKQEEIIQIIEDALEEKWLNLRDYDQEEAEEFEKAWNSIKIILKADFKTMRMKKFLIKLSIGLKTI